MKTINITEEMYLVAKSIVTEYEKPINAIDKMIKTDEEMKAKYDNLEKPCCHFMPIFKKNRDNGGYNRDYFKTFPRNPKLTYRPDGNIDHDPKSREPKYCDYNMAREVIRQAKKAGYDHAHLRTSTAVERELTKDGYIDHQNRYNALITWKTG